MLCIGSAECEEATFLLLPKKGSFLALRLVSRMDNSYVDIEHPLMHT
jgi:hypothetical protein